MPQVTLDDELAELIDRQIMSGRFSTPSDVVRAGLRLLDEADLAQRRAELRAEIVRRIADPAPMLTADEVFAGLRAYHAEAAAKDRGAG